MEKGEETEWSEGTGENNEEVNGITSVSEDCFIPISKDVFRQIHFSAVLSKIDEVDELRIKSSSTSDEDDWKEAMDKEKTENKVLQSPHVVWKAKDEIIHFEENKQPKGKQRPKSASCGGKKSGEKHSVKRSSSATIERRETSATKGTLRSSNRNSDSESNSESSLISVLGRPKSAASKNKYEPWNYECSLDAFYSPSRPRSICGIGTCFSNDCCKGSKGSWVPCGPNSGKYQPRKCRSNPCLTRSKRGTNSNSDFRIARFKRSLKLLGLEVTDFGIYDSASDGGQNQRPRWKGKKVDSTFSTKVVKRSISLDDLKEIVREAWLDDRLGNLLLHCVTRCSETFIQYIPDISHRKLLAQAAYEEWYFRKAEEAHKKLNNEKIKNKVVKEKLDSEFQSRKIKAAEQFQKWIAEKKKKLKTEKNLSRPSLPQFRVNKTREEVELAFQRWKKEKDKQKDEKQKLEMMEKAKEINKQKQKEEKKQLAEKAFIEWKRKLEETEKSLAEAQRKKEKRKKEMERHKRESENKMSFQMWKEMKDRELMVKCQEKRNINRIANALHSAKLEERMYEAEQAFEEWLEKLETRENVFKSKTVS